MAGGTDLRIAMREPLPQGKNPGPTVLLSSQAHREGQLRCPRCLRFFLGNRWVERNAMYLPGPIRHRTCDRCAETRDV
ncbi:MAG: hypothetical protein HYW81_02750 [Parcubacteria group bacterium]|nr:hypothetical protein [Parcubacteria group bacterium]